MGDWQGEQNWSNYNQQDWNQQGQVSERREGLFSQILALKLVDRTY